MAYYMPNRQFIFIINLNVISLS